VNYALALALGADASTRDAARLLRAPFTTNFPNAAKRARGRVACESRLVYDMMGLIAYDLADLPREPLPAKDADDNGPIPDPEPFGIEELDPLVRKIVVKGGFKYKSRSDHTYQAALLLMQAGYRDAQVLWAITNPAFACAAHILDQHQRGDDPCVQAMRTIRDIRSKGLHNPGGEFGEEAEPTVEETVNERKRAMEAGTRTNRVKCHLRVADKPRIVRQLKRVLVEENKDPALPPSDMVFRRFTDIVHLSRNEVEAGEERDDEYHVANDLVARGATPGWLQDRIDRSVAFWQYKGKDADGKPLFVPASCPQWAVKQMSDIITRPDFPELLGTTETPALRADGTLLTTPGYDRKSRIYYDPGLAVFPEIPDKPTKADALAAAELFVGKDGILCDFQFHDEPGEPQGLSKSVALAMLLTTVSRRALETSPWYGIDANEVESGKTLLAKIAGALATGREIAVRPWPTDEYQIANTLLMAFESGDPVLIYDNIDRPIESGTLNAVITSQTMAGRRLGSNSGKDEMRVPTNAVGILTGNHLVLVGDMTAGRVLITRIIPDTPLKDRKFKHRDLLSYVIKNRPALVAALLTILRAYSVTREKVAPNNFRHTMWSARIAGAAQWLGLPNPTLAQERAAAVDPMREVQDQVVAAWLDAFGDDWVTIGQMIEYRHPTEGSKIAALIGGYKGMLTHQVTHKTVAPFLNDLKGLTRLGYRIEYRAGKARHASQWRLRAVDEHPEKRDPQPHDADEDEASFTEDGIAAG
jgi:hypothetical protein